MARLNPTLEQQDIVQAVSKGKTLKIEALAGTGKTSTLLMIAEEYPRRKGLYLAYNAALKNDAVGKFPDSVDCKTVHGLAYREFGGRYKAQLSDNSNSHKMARALEIEEFRFKIDGQAAVFSSFRMLHLAKEAVKWFTFSDKDDICLESVKFSTNKWIFKEYPALVFEVVPDEDDDPKGHREAKNKNAHIADIRSKLSDVLFQYATSLWREQQNPKNDIVPANHDTYLKLYQLSKPVIDEYDYIMLDEAQDANPCILDILAHQSCQIIYVGDRYQQIYAFRGTINAMDKIQGETLYLTQSFRFGDAIAGQANIVLKMLSSEMYIKGFPSRESQLGKVDKPYTFIARNNATLIQECLSQMKKGHKCCLLTDTKGVVSLIRSVFYLWNKQRALIKDERVLYFSSWDDFVKFARESEDRELLSSIDFVLKNEDETLDVLRKLEKATRYSESEADIVLSTAHKSKGREWDNVSLSGSDFSLKNSQEMNLYYVALTRAKNILEHDFPQRST